MKHRIIAASLALMLALPAAADTIRTADRIVAVVDNEVITQRQLNQAIAFNRSRDGAGSAEEQQRQALAQLINQSLLVQLAKRNNISVSPAEIEAEITQAAVAARQTPAQFRAAQARIGIDEQGLTRQIADSLLADKIRQGTLLREGRVSDEEINAIIAQNPNAIFPEAQPKPQYRAQHILINGHSETAQRLARQIAQEARSGQDFGQLARQYSQDTSASTGGDLGWVNEGETVPEFERVLKSLSAGEISRPVRSQYGWHVIRLNDKRTPTTREDRIREGLRQTISEQKTQAAMTQLLQQLHQNSYISIRP